MNPKYLISISTWLSRNVTEFIQAQKEYDGVFLIEVIIEPDKHPHYQEATKFVIRHNGACFVIDVGRSGSPSCWNWYDGYDCDENNIIEDIFDVLVDVKNMMKAGHESEVNFIDEELSEIFDEILMDKEL